MFLACNEEVTKTNEFEQVGFDNDIELLYEASDEWCEATNGRHCATFEGGENTIELLSISRYLEIVDNDYSVGVVITCLGHVESRILIKDRIDERTNMKKTIMHELGHHFGCDHVSDEGDIMSIWESEVEHLTARDIECVN